jgi:signal transduction histidine kinase
MTGENPVEELASVLRADIERAAAGEPFDADAALSTLARLERATSLLSRVSLQSFDQFEQRIGDLSLISTLGRVFVAIFDPQRLSDALLEVVGETIPCESSFFLLADDAKEFELFAAAGPEPASREIELVNLRLRSRPRLAVSRIRRACPGPSGAGLPARSGRRAVGRDRAHRAGPRRVLTRARSGLAPRLGPVRPGATPRTRLSREPRAPERAGDARRAANERGGRGALRVESTGARRRGVEYTQELSEALPPLIELRGLALELPEAQQGCVARARELAAAGSERFPDDRISGVVEDFGDLLGETQEGLDRIRRVGDDLRSFAQGTTGVMEPADLNRLCETALHIVKAEAKERVTFEFRPAVLPPVRCQRFQITQVLLNLMQNAAESIEDEGSVRICTRTARDWAEVEIADEGCGIAPDQRERIFEPFLTTKLKGSGLGLSISRDIVRAHRGSLDVQSCPGEGSVFTLRLAVGGPGVKIPEGDAEDGSQGA